MKMNETSLGYGRENQLALIPEPSALFGEPIRTSEDSLVDLKTIWTAIYRNRYTILIVTAVCLALGVLSLLITSPTYRGVSSVEIDQQAVKVLGTETSDPFGGSQEADRMLQTQIDVLHSRALAERVDNSLGLSANDNFLREMGVKPIPGARHDLVVGTLMTNLIATLPRSTRVIPIMFDSETPAVAAQIANSYADNLIASNLQRKFDTSNYSKQFLEAQLALTKARLENSERALLTYARSVGLVDPSAGINGGIANADSGGVKSLTTANLVDLNNALAAAKATRLQAQQRWQQAQSTPVMSLPEVLSNNAIQQLTQRRAEQQAAYEEQLQRRKADYPAVQQAAASLHELDRQIGTLAESIRTSIRNQYIVAQGQESAIANNVQQLKGATLAEQGLAIRYNILKREVDTNRQLYDGLLQRFKEVSAESGVTSNNISIVDRATIPHSPVSPNPLTNLGLALIAGLVLSIALVTIREMLDDGVRSPDEVEDRFNLPLLGAVPLLGKRDSVAHQLLNPRSAVSEAYQTVRASIELSSEVGTPRSLLVTSGRDREGKSTTALAIAKDLANSGKRVLLLDADLRRPSIHTLLGLDKEPGLTNLLTQRASFDQFIRQTDTEGLDVLTAGPQPPSPAELLSGARFASVLQELKSHYDHVVVDGPPVLGLADAPQIAAVTDGTLLVLEANRAHRGAIKAAIRRLLGARARIIGAVLTKFDVHKAGFGNNYLVDYYQYGSEDDPARLGDLGSAHR